MKQKKQKYSKRIRFSRPYSTRFKIPTEKKLQQFCIEHEVLASEVIQAAVECLLSHDNCVGRKTLLEELIKGRYSF